MKTVIAVFVALLPNAAKKIVLRTFFGATIGRGVKIGLGTVLIADSIELGDGVCIGMFTYVHAHHVVMGIKASIGSRTHISLHALRMGARSTIAGQVTVAGEHDERGSLSMGMYSWIFQFCYINVSRSITLGRNVGVGGGTYIFTHGYWLSELDGFPVSYAPVTIGDDTWLPWGCFIMPGVTIGSRVIVGARSVVTKSVPDDAIVAGMPAKVIRDKSRRTLSLEDKKAIFEKLIYDYASRCGATIQATRGDESVVYKLSSNYTINVCDDKRALMNGIFNVCWAELDGSSLCEFEVWSLCNYISSPEEKLSVVTVRFLAFARSIGLRFYPVDEI